MGDYAGQPEHTITVSGTGHAGATSDVAEITVGVSVTRSKVKDARAAAASAMSAVVSAVKGAGIADKDVQTLNLSLSPVYNYEASPPKLTGCQLANTVRITVRDLSQLPVVVDGAAEVGATAIHGISFRLENPVEVEARARKLAMADARARAEALTQAAGVSIKGVASIGEAVGGFAPPQPPVALMRAVAEATPVEAGTTEVTVAVTVSYLIG
jgi:uncharacterized protein YggE